MDRPKQGTAEYYRHHKRCLDLAIELGCTPREAECEIRRAEAKARWATTEADLRTKARIAEADQQPVNDERWMMRN